MQNHFDEVAKDWDKNLVHLIRAEAIANKMLNSIPIKKSMKALEFGAGTGLLGIELKNYFNEITLMDNSVEMNNIAVSKIQKAGINNIKTIVFDLEKNKYIDEKFDIIYSQMSLHHVVNIEEIILKFHEMLNPKGFLSIADLYKEDGTFHDDDQKVQFGFEPEDLVNMLKKSGFKNVEYKQCFEIKKVNNEMERNYPIFLMVAEKNDFK